MSILRSRPKTQQSTQQSPFKHLFAISEKQLLRANSKNDELESFFLLKTTQFFPNKAQSRVVKEQNIRLITKLMEISQRKSKVGNTQRSFALKKRENPEREREIMLQNQRLGRSIVMIKSGKSVERIKFQIAKNIEKEQRRKKKLLERKLQGALHTQPIQAQQYSEILELSKSQNISSTKRLQRTGNLRQSDIGNLRKTLV